MPASRGSATFRGLVQRLEDSDVIVYVDLKPSMASDISGALEFMGAVGRLATSGSPSAACTT